MLLFRIGTVENSGNLIFRFNYVVLRIITNSQKQSIKKAKNTNKKNKN